jgi:hypothetical protein
VKKKVLFFLCLSIGMCATAQVVRFNCKMLPNKVAKLYWREGGKVDSLSAVLDNSGNAVFRLPDTSRKILAFISVNGSGREFIAGEPDITLVCQDASITKDNITFIGSPENTFLCRSFDENEAQLRKLSWVEAGLQQYGSGTELHKWLNVEKSSLMNKLQQIDEERLSSPLFSARFLQLNAFLERLFAAESRQDTALAVAVQKEMEQTLDFASLYTCGNLWNNIPNYYISLFNRINKWDKRKYFAASACKILDRLQEPYYSALLVSFIKETERFGWMGAGETIVKHALATRPALRESADLSPDVKRILSMVDVSIRKPAPMLEITDDKGGITLQNVLNATGQEGALVIFYETGCEFCEHELQKIAEKYALLQQKGIRVISITSDPDRKVFEQGARAFPWPDKLFDGKGFAGQNFKNYAVLGTPTLFVVDKEGKIAGRYARLVDSGLVDK